MRQMLKCGVILLLVVYNGSASVLQQNNSISDEYFWHLTDLHYDPTYWTTQDSCNRPIPPDRLGRYGDYDCDSPWQLIDSAVANMKLIGPTPKFIVWTGDSVLHPMVESSKSEDLVLDILRNLTRLINDSFPGIPVYVTLGNHDYFPTSQFPGHPNRIYNVTAVEIWSDWLETEENRRSFAQGGFYSKRMSEVGANVRAVVLNTNLYASSNKVVAGDLDPAGQFEWFTQILQSARINREKLHIITHIPPGVMEESDSPRWLTPEFNEQFIQLLQSYSDVIIAVYSAHQHFDSFRMIYSTDGRPVSSILIPPSVTPWKARIPNNTTGRPHNPGIRRFFYNSQSFQLVDYEQYYLDLTIANSAPADDDVSWTLLYSFRSTYSVQDMTAVSMNKILNDLKADANNRFTKYVVYNTLGATPELSGEQSCNCQCKYHHLCSIQYLGYKEFDTCIRQMSCNRAEHSKSTISLVTFNGLILTIIFLIT